MAAPDHPSKQPPTPLPVSPSAFARSEVCAVTPGCTIIQPGEGGGPANAQAILRSDLQNECLGLQR